MAKKITTFLLTIVMVISTFIINPIEAEAFQSLFTKYYEINYNGSKGRYAKIIKLPLSAAKKYTVYYISKPGKSIGAVYRDPTGKDKYGLNTHARINIEYGDKYVYSGRKFKAGSQVYFEFVPVKEVDGIYVTDVYRPCIGIKKGYFTKMKNKKVVIGCAQILKSDNLKRNLNMRYSDSYMVYRWNGIEHGGFLTDMQIGYINMAASSGVLNVTIKKTFGLLAG